MADLLTSSPAAHAVGLALVHFLWQGAVLGVVAALLFETFRRATPQTRYLIGCAVMAAMTAAVALTFVGYLRQFSVKPSGLTAVSELTASTVARLPAAAATDAPWFTTARAWAEMQWPVMLLIWAGGVLALSAQLLRGWLLVQRVRRNCAAPSSDEWSHRVAGLAARLNIRRPLRLLESTWTDVPSVIGWIRPIIVIPASALSGLSPEQFEAIIAHELAHVRRHDYFVNVLQSVLEVVLFYHPAVWWVSRRVRIEREHCCDDLAADVCGDRVAYAAALTSLEESRAETFSLAMGARGGDLLSRVRRLVGSRPAPSRALPAWAGIAAVMTIVSIVIGAQERAAANNLAPAPVATVAPSAANEVITVTPRSQVPSADTRAPRAIRHADAAAKPQVLSGTITGAVVDPQGGRLPGATVKVLSVDDPSKSATAVTNVSGRYAVAVSPGMYDVMIWLPGFKTSVVRIQARAGETRVDMRLDLGSVKESITTMGTLPAGAVPAAPQPVTVAGSASDYFEAAKRALDQGRPAEASSLISQGLTLQQQQLAPVAIDANDQAPVRVGGDIKEPKKIHDVKPAYPPDALAAGVQGIVIIEAIIARDGSVRSTKILRSQPSLDQAAMDAVKQWGFTPTLLNGVPVEVIMTVTVNFTLGGE